jgi:hypothetical protein
MTFRKNTWQRLGGRKKKEKRGQPDELVQAEDRQIFHNGMHSEVELEFGMRYAILVVEFLHRREQLRP